MNIEVTPKFLKALMLYKGLNATDLFKFLGLDSVYTKSYLHKVFTGKKPVSESFNKAVNDEIEKLLSTHELITVIKIQELLK